MTVIAYVADRPMNLEAIRLWEQALRSGEFQQGTGRLGSYDLIFNDLGIPGPGSDLKSCCLGVLCEVAIRNGVNVPRHVVYSSAAERYVVEYGYGHGRDFLPVEVREWAGLRSENPHLSFTVTDGDALMDLFEGEHGTQKVSASASSLNDGESCSGLTRALTFEEIADAIRQTYLKEVQAEADAQNK